MVEAETFAERGIAELADVVAAAATNDGDGSIYDNDYGVKEEDEQPQPRKPNKVHDLNPKRIPKH
jgi:hypothetical protein